MLVATTLNNYSGPCVQVNVVTGIACLPDVWPQDIDLGSRVKLEIHPRRRKKKKKKSRSGLQPRFGHLLAAGCNFRPGDRTPNSNA